MMWLKLKKMWLKIMKAYEEYLLSPVSVEDRLVTSEYAKKIYDVVYCSFQSIVFLAAIKLAIEHYDNIILKIFYLIGYCSWSVYLFTVITFLISTIIEKYTTIDLEGEKARIIYNTACFCFTIGFSIFGPKIIVDFVNMKFPIN